MVLFGVIAEVIRGIALRSLRFTCVFVVIRGDHLNLTFWKIGKVARSVEVSIRKSIATCFLEIYFIIITNASFRRGFMKSCCLSRGIQIACMTGVLMKRRKGFWREYGESQTALADLEFIA